MEWAGLKDPTKHFLFEIILNIRKLFLVSV